MLKPRVTSKQRAEIETRAEGRCEYCQSPAQFAVESFASEHILPHAKGGETALSNLAFSCGGCNGHKHTRTEWRDPLTDEIVPLYHPRQQKWTEHFAWNIDYTLVIGLTPIGRATVAALQLNRSNLVNFRRALIAIDEHPPTD